MSKATEVMMQYVENLKRTYEKDHAELMEFKKLANQNSSRSYGASGKKKKVCLAFIQGSVGAINEEKIKYCKTCSHSPDLDE